MIKVDNKTGVTHITGENTDIMCEFTMAMMVIVKEEIMDEKEIIRLLAMVASGELDKYVQKVEKGE